MTFSGGGIGEWPGFLAAVFSVAFSGGGIGEWPGFLAAGVFVVPGPPDLNAFAIVLVSFLHAGTGSPSKDSA